MIHISERSHASISSGPSRRGVALVRFSALGDCVLLCPLARRLKDAGLGEIVVVTKRQFAELFSAATGVDRVLSYDPVSGISGLMRLAARIRKEGYAIVDAHATLRSRLFCARAGRPVAMFDKRYRDRLGLIVFKRKAHIPTMLDRYGALAKPLGVPTENLRPGGLALPERVRDIAARRIGDGGGARWIAVAPGSRWPAKTWESERFGELARRLADRGFHVVTLGDAGERDLARDVAARAGGAGVVFAGNSILETAAVLERCEMLIGNDSGLVHLSEAVQTPVLAIYGPTVEAFGYYPRLALSRTIESALSCRPCSRNGATPCVRGTRACMTAIDVDAVETAAVDLVEGRERSRYHVGSS